MSYSQCPGQCQVQPGKLVPIPLKCGNVNILQPTECPQIYIPSSEIGLCDLVLLPDTDDPIGVLANLPILLLFTISAPARFFYCSLLYNALISADFFTVIENIINTFLDIILNPIFSLAQGFINGDNGSNFNPGSVVNSAVIPQTCLYQIPVLGTIINTIDQALYTIGYAFGYLFYLIKYLYDNLLYLICFIVNFGVEFCVAVGVTVPIPSVSDGKVTGFTDTCISACGCTGCFQPFAFLKPLVCGLINCSCFTSNACYVIPITIGCSQKKYQSGYTCS